jgi:VanZ family protein
MMLSPGSVSREKETHASRWCWTGVFGLLFVFVCYLSLKPSPSAGSVPWFPVGVAHWFDRHDHWRNFVGYSALAFAGLMAFARRDAVVTVSCCLLVVLLELSQLWLPRRTCDWADIACGCAGIVFSRLMLCVWSRQKRVPG